MEKVQAQGVHHFLMRRRANLALLVGALVLIGVAGVIVLHYVRSSPAPVLVLSSPYITGVQIGQGHCPHSGGSCPQTVAWPVVSDATTSGYVVGDTLATTNGSWR